MKKFFLGLILLLFVGVGQVMALSSAFENNKYWKRVTSLAELNTNVLETMICIEDGNGGNQSFILQGTPYNSSYSTQDATQFKWETTPSDIRGDFFETTTTLRNMDPKLSYSYVFFSKKSGDYYKFYAYNGNMQHYLSNKSEAFVVESNNDSRFLIEEDGSGHFYMHAPGSADEWIKYLSKNYTSNSSWIQYEMKKNTDGEIIDVYKSENGVNWYNQFKDNKNLGESDYVYIAITIYQVATPFTATFNFGDHGQSTDSKNSIQITGVEITLPEVVTAPGWEFEGWFDPNDVNVGITGTVSRSENTTFTAHYKKAIPAAQDFEVINFTNDGIVFETSGSYSKIEVAWPDTDEPYRYTLLNCKLSGDVGVFTIPFDGTTLQEKEGQTLSINFIDGNDNLTACANVLIPTIVNGEINSSALTTPSNVYVLNGGKLTIDANCTLANLHISGGAKVVIATGQILTVSDKLIMHGGAIENKMYSFAYPQLVLNGTLATSGTVYYDYLINNDQYYALVLPYEATIANITYRDGSAMVRGDGTNSTYDYKIQFYDGATRAANGASGGTGWALVAPGTTTLQPGVGYNIFAKPQTVRISGGTSQRQKYAMVRIPMTVGTSLTETAAKNVSVSAHPADKNNDAGWNLIGNPYLSNFQALSLTEDGIGLLVDNGDGYEWSGTQRYVVIPANDGQSYSQTLASSANLPAFKSFFVQVATNAQLAFPIANRVASAPALMVKEEPAKEIMMGLTIAGCSMTDNMGVLIGEQFTDAYEINADLDKWTNNGLNIYALSNNNRLAYIALPQASAKNIALGVATTQAGTYTIALDESFNNSEIESIQLYDSQTKQTVNLMAEDYTFSTTSGRVENRFSLIVTLVAKSPTGCNTLKAGQDAAYYDILGNYLGTKYETLPSGTFIQVVDGKANQIMKTR